MPQRTWSYRGFVIETDPKLQRLAFIVWIDSRTVLAATSLAEIQSDIDRRLSQVQAAA